MMFRFLIIIWFPLSSIAQQEVLDGIYISSQTKPEEFGKNTTQIGGDIQMYSEHKQYEKHTKIAGFQFLYSSDYFLEKVQFDERNTGNRAFNTYIYIPNQQITLLVLPIMEMLKYLKTVSSKTI